ncbi:cellulase family glycosylhydrolase [Flavobacterium sp. UBA6031]|uniref:cellulase family glycosylhydrolase n=1 Tax=Flavobacterium sp. UBA6031 TaxID=1946551 RepID=UPI0025BF72DA|nr:cellulase family glycosylhydrolase [Flavobacterium sp. UBA6031]
MKNPQKLFNLRFVSIVFVLLMSTSILAELPTAKQIASKMKLGWNLGNTLEATWATPGNASQRLIDSVKAAGFNSVRLPCAWYHNSNKTTNIINASYLAQVKKNVDYCIKDSMYVMINIHWDEGWLENHVTVADSASVNAMQKTYWTQIANYFRDYDQHLLFACANEPSTEDIKNGGTVLESYIQTFIKAVRGTGGNNSSRTLIFQGHPDYSTIPKDEIPDRLMFEAHSYGYQFALLAKDDINPWGNGVDSLYCIYYWGKSNLSATDIKHNPTYDQEAEIANFFSNTLKTRFVDKGVPVILGEYGAWKRGTLASGGDMDLHNKSIEYYFYYMVNTALKNGAIPFVWDTGSLFNRSTGKVNDYGIVNSMVRAATDTIPATAVTIGQAVDSLAIGATVSLTAIILPSNATHKTIIWTSDNSSIAIVNSEGVVTGVKTGKATISAMAGVMRATKSIVVGVPVTAITITPKADTIKIGETVQLLAMVLPSNAPVKTVSWSSNPNYVATVSASGLLTAVSKGKAIITATTTDGSFKAICIITVSNETLSRIAQVINPDDIAILPNPLNGNQLTVYLGGLKGITTIQFIEINGQTVLEQTVFDMQRTQLDVNLKPGIYLVRFSNNQNTLTKKLLVY